MTDELEWQTRRDRINKKLRALMPAWNIIKFREGLHASALDCHAVEEYPTGNGPADYALFVKGKLLAVVSHFEPKKKFTIFLLFNEINSLQKKAVFE